MATAETARLIASLELQDKNFTRGLKNVERGVNRVDKKLGAASGALNRTLARGIDTVIDKGAELLVGTVKDATEFETAITGVAKTVTGDISGVTDELKKMSTEIPLSFVELAGIAELGGAMGIAKDDLVAFTEQVAILGTTTDVTVEDAATALGQLQNVVGLTGEEFDNFAASLVDLGNKGASTESQILEIAKRSGAAAKTVGVAKDEFLGWAAAAANLGINAELGGTALQNFFLKTQTAISGAGADFKSLAKISGMTAKDFKKMWGEDATGALTSFLGGLSKLTKGQRIKAIQDIYGKGSGMTRLILGLADSIDSPTGLNAALETNATSWDAVTAANEEAQKRFATSESLFKKLDNSVKIVSATVGEALLPVLNDLATEGIAFLNKPETQKGIKDFAKGLGEGIRGLAKVITSINWGAVAGFLSTAAGFAGQLVTWFTKMPDWAQAFLIGGFVATKLPVIGDLFSSLASGLIKGILGINAGIVNVTGPVAGMGGAPIPGGGPNASTLTGRITNLLRSGIVVGIAAVSIIALAETFKGFIDDVGKYQADLLEKVNKTNQQGFEETIGNLQATTKSIKNMNPLENVLAGIFGGSEIVKNYEMAADRIVKQLAAGELNRDEMVTALTALQDAVETSPEAELPGVESAIDRLTKAIRGTPTGDPKQPLPRGPVPHTEAKPGDNLFKQLNALNSTTNNQFREIGALKERQDQTKQEISNTGLATKDAVNTLNTSAVTGLGNVKNATTTLDSNSTFRAAAQIVSTGSTTTAVNTNASATRGVAPPIVSTLLGVGDRIAGAIWAARPVIQSTNVVNNYTQQQRTGQSSGSRARGGSWDD